MNTLFRPARRTAYAQSQAQPAILFPAMTPQTQWVGEAAQRPRPARRPALSAQQLLDVELGLFLVSQLLPTASPDALPSLLNESNGSFLERRTWTPRQHKLLNRGRALLAHIQQPNVWHALLDAYANTPDRLQAYDISTDRSRFKEKQVGFFRNRILMLKQTVG
ncbi:hypothetical protein BN8_04605 [Fibrisoma limi BUZ 3]|uniref:pPIWI-RE three-gene island domain-containing protein n=1 Tax=Fibrisoma limi BUZ 3 TaxID=1185876 RepID=I2GN73_9BACT|nr:hypothetical protein [Fibrisoma limi]CCH55351.1 hypothetical protein BN8_04605 [Fibrisoma limi BUZ 3]